MKYFGAIDQGTTSSRFIVFDETGSIIKQHQQEFTQYLPDEFSVEHDPCLLYTSPSPRDATLSRMPSSA